MGAILPNDHSDRPINLAAGHKYLNRSGSIIAITKVLNQSDNLYDEGYRFRDSAGVPYTASGSFSAATDEDHKYDLVSEYAADEGIMRKTEEVITEVIPGLFSRLKEKLQENPIKTSVAICGVGGVAAVGGYNYRMYGRVVPVGLYNRREDVVVAAAFVKSVLSR